MSTSEAEDQRAVGDAYRAVRRRGGKDHAAFQAAVQTLMHRHPGTAEGPAIAEAARLLDLLGLRHQHWLYGNDSEEPW